MRTIAIDFDGVIHQYSAGWGDGSVYDDPVAGAFEALHKLMGRFAVFIFTSRNTNQVAYWLAANGFNVTTDDTEFKHDREWNGKFWDVPNVLLITNRKLGAEVYIDDRGLRFETWEQTLNDIERLTTLW